MLRWYFRSRVFLGWRLACPEHDQPKVDDCSGRLTSLLPVGRARTRMHSSTSFTEAHRGKIMSEPGSADYIHGTSATEQGRLSLLNSLLNKSCLHELNLQGTERIIDFGCG